MQYFTLRAQDGVQCLVVAVLLLRGFVLRFVDPLSQAFRRTPGHRETNSTNTWSKNGVAYTKKTVDFGFDNGVGANDECKLRRR